MASAAWRRLERDREGDRDKDWEQEREGDQEWDWDHEVQIWSSRVWGRVINEAMTSWPKGREVDQREEVDEREEVD